jgi:5,10-methylenetetrahydromethanopterin reductase
MYPASAPPASLPAFARNAEAMGFTELWVVEDCFLSGGMALAASALAVTERIRVGIGLLPAAVRNPAIVAMEIATLAGLAPGRVVVAFGHGVEAWMRQIGARPRNRLAALAETVSTVRALLHGETVTHHGRFVDLEAVALDFSPTQPPPILIGTTGDRGIALAAEVADGLLLPEGCGAPFIAKAREALVAARAGAGDGAEPELVVYAWARAGESEHDRTVLEGVVNGWARNGMYPRPMAAAGVPSPYPESAPDSLIASLTISGSRARCRDAAQSLIEAGATRVVLCATGEDSDDQYQRLARDLADLTLL